MIRPSVVPPYATLLHRATTRVAQSVNSGIPIVSALKYEFHHQLYPLLASEAGQRVFPRLPVQHRRVDLKQTLGDSRLKARFIDVLLSALAVNLLACHDIALDASDYDDLLTDELGGAGETALQAAMVRSITHAWQDMGQDGSQVVDIDVLRNRQSEVVKSLNEHGATVHTLHRAQDEVEALVDEFWQIESQIDELMHGETDWRYWP